MSLFLHRLLLSCAVLLALPRTAAAAEVKVFAAASLMDVMQTLAKDYAAVSPDHISFNFAGSNVLARQIEQGAPADIFFSADDAQMKNLQQAGLVDAASHRELLSNTLVIIAAKGSTLTKLQPADLAKPTIQRIALADPRTVPAGVYAKAYLKKQGLWPQVEHKVVPTANVRAALAAVESGNAEVGIVYRTDATLSKTAGVIYAVSRAEGPKIAYPIALLKASADNAAARKFLTFLESPGAQARFVQAGFLSGHE